MQEYNRAKGERDRLKDQYNQQLASISSLQSSRSELMQQQREVTQEITGLQSRRTQADLNRQVEEAREALEEAESDITYINPENQQKELGNLFYGYDVFDTAFKKTINLFLSQRRIQQSNLNCKTLLSIVLHFVRDLKG